MKEEERKEQTEFNTKIRADFLKRVGTSYRVAKSARRSLRAAGLTNRFNKPPKNQTSEQIASYQEHMQVINQTQLELEALKIEAKSLHSLVKLQKLSKLLRTMEQYLGKLVKEYEEINPILLV